MNIFKEVTLRTPAKSLEDVEIDKSVWEPDFAIVDQYQKFAGELLRIGLLGLAGFGFLIKEVVLSEHSKFKLSNSCATYLTIASILIIITVMLVLFHRFLSTACLYCQIIIMRSLKRLNNSHWTETEMENEKFFLKHTRSRQRKMAYWSHRILMIAAICFALGFLFVILVFQNVLTNAVL